MSVPRLRLALVDGPAYTPLNERLDDLAREAGIEVEVVERRPMDELAPLVRQAVAAGEPFDLVASDSRYAAALAPYLYPLDGLLPAELVSDLQALPRELCSIDGALCQFPRAIETRLLFYRSDIFEDRRERAWFAEASGGRELRVPPTWDDLAAVAQYFTRAGKMHGFAFAGQGPALVQLFAEIVVSVGGAFLDPDGRSRFFSRAGEWALTLLHDLYSRWHAVAEETPRMRPDDAAETFRMGRCALVCDTPGTASLLRDPTFSAVAGWHSVAMVPAGGGGQRAAWTGCSTFAVPASAPLPEEAGRLLAALVSAESQALEARNGATPARASAWEAAKDAAREGTLGHLRLTLVEQTLRVAAYSPPPLPTWPDIEAALAPSLQRALTGEQPVVAALEAANESVTASSRL